MSTLVAVLAYLAFVALVCALAALAVWGTRARDRARVEARREAERRAWCAERASEVRAALRALDGEFERAQRRRPRPRASSWQDYLPGAEAAFFEDDGGHDEYHYLKRRRALEDELRALEGGA